MIIRKVVRLGVASLLAMTAVTRHVAAQADAAYPNRPVHIVVGFSPGGGNDILARLVGQKLSESLGQPVIIDNKPGAGGIIATDAVAKAVADGHTLMMGPTGSMTIAPAIYQKLGYVTLRDFVPISMVASFPLFLVVNASSPHNSVQEVVAYAKANPSKSNYASSSAAFQLTTELFKLRTGAPIEHIGYRGSGDSLVALMAGTVLMAFIDAPPVSSQIKAGQVRALAVTAGSRMAEFPDIPTMAETGIPDMEVKLWSGLFAPARTPPPIVRKLEAEVARIVRLPDIRARMRELVVEPEGNTSDEFARIVAADLERWSAVAMAANIRIEQ
jgi:tripartite-type tricarboxylate transporter receptor subunit TctC